MRLYFVTPVHRRFELTRIVLEQRRRLCDALTLQGVDAGCVVVGCDSNLRAARDLGFDVVERANDSHNDRFNDGMEYACRELGADYVVPLGSDDWALSGYFLPLPEPGTVRASRRLGLVAPDGSELSILRANDGTGPNYNPHGYIPWVIPAAMIEPFGYRPTDGRFTEHSIAQNVGPDHFRLDLADPLQVVDFKSPDEQITSYSVTVDCNPVEAQYRDPWEALATRYPFDLVERMEALYAQRRRAHV